MSNDKDNADLTAALKDKDRAGLVNALKKLAGQRSDVLQNPTPKMRKRVDALRDVHAQHDELEAKFLEERAVLEAKYQKLYQPLYTKRKAMDAKIELKEKHKAFKAKLHYTQCKQYNGEDH